MRLELRIASSPRPQTPVRLSDQTVKIGSLTSNQIHLADPGVEPIHCLIDRKDDNTWWVVDLGALSGVRLNGRLIDVEAEVKEGDVLEIGTARIIVQKATLGEQVSKQPRSRLFYHPRAEPSRGRMLEVVAYWGDTVLNVDHFHPDLKGFDSVTIGDPTKAHFISGGRDFFVRKVLADVRDGNCTIRLDSGMEAHVRQDGKIRKVVGDRHMTIGSRDYAHIDFGPVRYFLHYANQPNVVLPRRNPVDAVFATLSAIGSFAYLVLVTLALMIKPKPLESSLTSLDSTPYMAIPKEEQPKQPKVVTLQMPKQPEPVAPIAVAKPVHKPIPKVDPPKVTRELVQQALQPKPKVDPVKVEPKVEPHPVTAQVTKPSPVLAPKPTNVAENANATPKPKDLSQIKGPSGAAAGEHRPSIHVGSSGGPGQKLAATNPMPAGGHQTHSNPGVEGGRRNQPSTLNLRALGAGFGHISDLHGGSSVSFNSSTGGSGMKSGSVAGTHYIGGTGAGTQMAIPGSSDQLGSWGRGPGSNGRGGDGPGGVGGNELLAGLTAGRGGPGGGGHAPVSVGIPSAPLISTVGLSAEEIQFVIRQNLNQIRHCYEQLLQRVPKAAGRLKVAFSIGIDGRVTTTSVVDTTMTDPMFRACTFSAIKRWTFPRPRGGSPVQVSYPFVFNPL